MLTTEIIQKLDPQDMRGTIRSFHEQVEEAAAIGRKFTAPGNSKSVANIVLAGMGGSAIGGDLLRAYLGMQLAVPFSVSRHYVPPPYLGRDTLFIVSSYSGNTEETLAAYEQAVARNARVLCITSGGEVAERAKKLGHPVIFIPGGLQPRAALGYSFFPLLFAMGAMGFARVDDNEITETITVLKTIAGESLDSTDSNQAYAVARQLHGKIPVIWSSSDLLEPVNLRWRGQINENAKQLAWSGWLPELNHNEIVGWQNPDDMLQRMAIVLLKDREDNARVVQRMAITKDLLKNQPGAFIEIGTRGESRLARMFSVVHRGDWVSFHLAMLNGVDPTPVERINHLKNQLAKTPVATG
jgi:glucose/mannose-6-phosphate isomerase